MSLKLIIGTFIFLSAIATIFILTIPKNNITQTTTPVINKTTTIIPLPTTTPLITPTPLITTTSVPVTTTIKPRSIFFSSIAGTGGKYSVSGSPGGGGGAGGIVINNDTYLTAGIGQISMSSSGGGSGGKGYGAGGGGGGAGLSTFKGIGTQYIGGNGTQGFVYIVEEDKLFTTDIQNYIPQYIGTYTFILMGGGGCGGSGISTSGFPGNGGDAGQIIIKKIKGITAETKINITIGQGGKIINFAPTKAGNTTVSCILTSSTINISAIGASPATSGDKTNIQGYIIQSGGGSNGQSGGVVNSTIINNMNSKSPIEM